MRSEVGGVGTYWVSAAGRMVNKGDNAEKLQALTSRLAPIGMRRLGCRIGGQPNWWRVGKDRLLDGSISWTRRVGRGESFRRSVTRVGGVMVLKRINWWKLHDVVCHMEIGRAAIRRTR